MKGDVQKLFFNVVDEDDTSIVTRKRKRPKVSTKKVSSKSKSSKGLRKSQRKRLKIKRESDFEDYDDLDEYLKGSNGDDVGVDEEEMEVEEEVPHPCDKCKYVGKSKAHLDRHEQNQHAEVKPCKNLTIQFLRNVVNS